MGGDRARGDFAFDEVIMLFFQRTSGGIDSVLNVVKSKPAPNIVSGFFPYPQRQRIKSESTLSRGGAGQTFRPVRYEMQSVLETSRFRKKRWVGSPYEKEFAVKVKRKESKSLAELVTKKPGIIPRIMQ